MVVHENMWKYMHDRCSGTRVAASSGGSGHGGHGSSGEHVLLHKVEASVTGTPDVLSELINFESERRCARAVLLAASALMVVTRWLRWVGLAGKRATSCCVRTFPPR